MILKNKLTKHHKSRFQVISHRFYKSVATVFGIFMIISLPTYISISLTPEIPTQAIEENKTEIAENQLENIEEEVE